MEISQLDFIFAQVYQNTLQEVPKFLNLSLYS